MLKTNKLLFFLNIAIIPAIVVVLIANAWNSPTASPPNPAGQAAYVSPTGNIGIGTMTPQAHLHLGNGVTGGSIRLQGYSASGDTYGTIDCSDDNCSFDNSFTAGTELFIQYNGNVGIGTANPEATLQVNGTMKIFGSRVILSPFIIYQAPTDGFVVAISGANGTIYGYTDSNNPPTTTVARNGSGSTPAGSITFPVRKGDYWTVEGPSTIVYWVPFGN